LKQIIKFNLFVNTDRNRFLLKFILFLFTLKVKESPPFQVIAFGF